MRKSVIRRIVAVMLVCLTLVGMNSTAVMAAGVMPRYNNVGKVDGDAWVSGDELYINYDYTGTSTTTQAVITTTVEKKTMLFFWSDVAEWTDTVYSTTYYDTTTLQLDEEGTYRVTVEYVFYGTGGAADTVTCEYEVEY